MLVNDGEMVVNDGEMSVWSYTHFTIIDEHFTIVNKPFTIISLKDTIIRSFDHHWEAAPTEVMHKLFSLRLSSSWIKWNSVHDMILSQGFISTTGIILDSLLTNSLIPYRSSVYWTLNSSRKLWFGLYNTEQNWLKLL